MSTTPTDVEKAVRDRYSAAAGRPEQSLCCAVAYDSRYLSVIPPEILERDYGCGDPTRHLRRGDTVLDLGSGGGKICFIASQIVGVDGRVIGIDMNDEMLALAESARESVGTAIGYQNVEFHKGKIQDLALDYRKLETRLDSYPVRTVEDLERLETWKAAERRDTPMIAPDSVDVIVSNCVLNLVRPQDKQLLFREMYRVLRTGGRAVISDIVSDEDVPARLQADADLWSGCISGAFREDRFLTAFEDAGFHGMRIVERDERPWRVAEGIEFRSICVEAFKGKDGPCLERRQAVIYRGPWRSVTDDDGHTLYRGRRMAVCDKTLGLYTREPYAGQVEAVLPHEDVPLDCAPPFDDSRDATRHPRETKGAEDRDNTGTGCGPDSCC